MTDNELLNAISDMLDDKLKTELNPIKDDIESIKGEMQSIKGDIESMKGDIQLVKDEVRSLNVRVDNVELQIKNTKDELREEIHNSERLVLDEVERVHKILNNHKNDTTKHTA